MTRRQSLLLLAAAQSPDAKVILDQSVTLDEGNLEKLRGYVWNSDERTYIRGLQTAQQGYEINLVSGAMYWRRTEVNGQPLTGNDLANELVRLRRHLAQPGPGFNWREERKYLELLPLVHSATYIGQTTIEGRLNHIIETRPLPGSRARILNDLSYKLWIDTAELHWTRAEITVLRNTTWLLHQLAIGRISYPYSNNIVNSADLRKGARTTIELTRLPGGVWILSRHETAVGDNYRNELRYFNYRRFTSESQLLTGPP